MSVQSTRPVPSQRSLRERRRGWHLTGRGPAGPTPKTAEDQYALAQASMFKHGLVR